MKTICEPNISIVEQIISFASLHDITFISWGLAPNPGGFCYEAGASTCAAASEYMDSLLDALTPRQEKELRKLLF